MGKSVNLFKKIRATTGIFEAKMSTIKDRKGKEAEAEADRSRRD